MNGSGKNGRRTTPARRRYARANLFPDFVKDEGGSPPFSHLHPGTQEIHNCRLRPKALGLFRKRLTHSCSSQNEERCQKNGTARFFFAAGFAEKPASDPGNCKARNRPRRTCWHPAGRDAQDKSPIQAAFNLFSRFQRFSPQLPRYFYRQEPHRFRTEMLRLIQAQQPGRFAPEKKFWAP